MPENVSTLPIISCPSCGANILDAGFHNTCTENQKIREDNFTYTSTDVCTLASNREMRP